MPAVARAALNFPRKAAVQPQTVLARANRVVQPADFRTAVRRGRRVASRVAVVHVIDHGIAGPTRFGFIVSKAVGNAVVRNRIRRRLRAVGRDLLGELGSGNDIVIRALPGAHEVDWVTLHAEIVGSIRKGVMTR
ncbi:ribonuclease P protein component [Salinibacterium xinjiangense]|uniref:ribonuclease P protein component n=1 Tax=Salinibacterium xinjiangense TaxID=386302 RepID=UPI0027E59CBC|nr:ribonuclease P protein component [Salinibacterium xinjiangense]